VHVDDAEKIWRNANPLVWAVIRYRGWFGGDPAADCVHWHRITRPRRFNWRQIAHMMISGASHKRVSPGEVQSFKCRSNTQGRTSAADVGLGIDSR
jgi:hypothetical protein